MENYVHNEKINNVVELELVNIKNLLQTNGLKQKQSTYVKYSVYIYMYPLWFFFKFFNP